jgi:hypothetical protein
MYGRAARAPYVGERGGWRFLLFALGRAAGMRPAYGGLLVPHPAPLDPPEKEWRGGWAGLGVRDGTSGPAAYAVPLVSA